MRQSFRLHDYLSWYLAPSLAIWGALGLGWLAEQRRAWARLALVALLAAYFASGVRWLRVLYPGGEDFGLAVGRQVRELARRARSSSPT
ncbi:MAG: hypothetical protein HC915_17060 [Anaerolineae bacterium]|nr:hypothetical protein [Anaerolineae bacterium]